MATRLQPPPKNLYETDPYAWALEQAALLRARRFGELDLENLVEEVEDVAGSLRRSVRSRVRTIIEHLLKLEHSPATEPRAGWRNTVRVQRDDLDDDLTPTLRRELLAELPGLYARARGRAAEALADQGEAGGADSPPVDCPYSLDQVTGDWLP